MLSVSKKNIGFLAQRPPLQNSKIILTCHVSKLKHGDSETLWKKKAHCKIGTRLNRFQPFQILQILVTCFFWVETWQIHTNQSWEFPKGLSRLPHRRRRRQTHGFEMDSTLRIRTPGHRDTRDTSPTRGVNSHGTWGRTFFKWKWIRLFLGPKIFGLFGYEMILSFARDSKSWNTRNFSASNVGASKAWGEMSPQNDWWLVEFTNFLKFR